MAAVLVITACAARARAQDDPDALYRQREDLASAERAATILAASDASDYDAAWKLARVSRWIGTHAPGDEQRAALEGGIAAGEAAIRLAPDRPEGHFWLAADMGELAERSGIITGIKLVGRVNRELQRAIALAPLWQQGSAETALGQWYSRVPRLFGGSRSKGQAYLTHVLDAFPDNVMAVAFLAQLLQDDHRPAEARAMWERVLATPIDPDWAPEAHDFHRKATARLASLAKASTNDR